MSSPLDTLRGFLESRDRPAGTLNLEELQGFLFAVVNAPDLVASAEWIPAVFNGTDVAFESTEAADIPATLLALYARVDDASGRAPDVLPPGCVFRDDAASNLESDAAVARWSRGFRKGHQWLRQSWEAAFSDADDVEVNRELAFVLIALTFFSSRQVAEAVCAEAGGKDLSTVASAMARAFPLAVAQYVSFGRSLRQEALEPDAPPRAPARVGRNEPCPCGSGRKHKRCCGLVH